MRKIIYQIIERTDLCNLMLIRFFIGGKWYKQEMSGELPGCYGYWWTKKPLKPHRYHYISRIETW